MRKTLVLIVALIVAAEAWSLGQGATIVIKTAWAQQYRNRLSIDATMTVLALNPGKEADGDSHGGSRQNSVGLPMVAEILSSGLATQQAARTELAPGAHPAKSVYGAWRLWFEHPPAGGGAQCQTFSGHPPAICTNQSLTGADSNPAHSFEIHPVFDVDGVSIARSSMVLTPDNTSVKDPDKAFADYTGKNKILTIVRSASALTLTSITLQDNYVQMHLRVTRAKTATTRLKDGLVDGGFVLADVVSSSDKEHVLAKNVRVFYFRDCAPGDAMDKAKPGDEFNIVGMPRLNLDAVLTISEGHKSTATPVPFEFVIVALLKSS